MKMKDVYARLRKTDLPIYIWGNGEVAMFSNKKLAQEGITVSGFVTDDGRSNAGVEKQWLLDNVVKYILIRGFLGAYFMNDADIIRKWVGCEEVYSIMDCYESYFTEILSTEYFDANRERFITVRNLLADDISKRSMDAFIHAKTLGECDEIRDVAVLPQYFFCDAPWKYSENDVLFDCGAFNGDSIASFLKLRGDAYDSIIACEPDEKNYADLLAYIEKNRIRDVRTYPVGMYDCQTQLSFVQQGDKISSISEHGEMLIHVDSIDHLAGEKRITIIKMDIEGSEMKALEGAVHTIKRDRPILMISAYHKRDDIFNICEFVNELVADYDFYFRCHKPMTVDAVLYAVPRERVK